MSQCQFATTLEIDTPMYSKIDQGKRSAKRKQIVVIAKLLKIDENMLVTLLLADKIIATEDKEFVGKAFKVVKKKNK